MVIEQVLEELGLTKIEIKVYLALLERGTALASIISRKSGIHRRSVYDAVERLIEKGLACYIVKNNRRYYSVTNPNRLLKILQEKEAHIHDILPELTKKFEKAKPKMETNFYQGMHGLKIIYEDMIKEGGDIKLIAATTYHDVNRFFFPPFDRKRKEQKQKIQILFPESMRGKHSKIILSKVKYLPDEYISTVATNIYGDNVSISLWTKNPIAILIRQKEISDNYRRQFDILWVIAKD